MLPISSASAARPLVLSLYVHGPGGDKADYELIPKFMGPAGAGRDVKAADGAGLDQIGDMAFSYGWLRDNLAHTSGQLASIQVRGDSMAGTLIDGETIIIDTAVKRVDVSGIYVITHHGDRLVKRIDRKLDGSLVIISDNPRYSPDVLARSQAGDIEVMGRMVWPRVR
jgi:phage repressor protein C with HTH and peptisase S24 domain